MDDQPEDDQLIAALARDRHDAEAFATLVRRHGPLVHGVCRRVLRDAHLAEDAAQEVFLQLLRQPPRPPVRLGAWLHRAATGTAIDLVRSERARREREALTEPARGRESGWDDVAPEVDAALAELDDDQRDLLVRHFLAGVGQQRLAEERAESQPTVSRRIAEALEALRDRLRRRGLAIAALALSAGLATAGWTPLPPGLGDRLLATRLAGPRGPRPRWIMAGAAGTALVIVAWAITRGPFAAADAVPRPDPTPPASAAAQPSDPTWEDPAVPAAAAAPIRVTGIVAELGVADVARSLRYYRDALGFTIDFTWFDDGRMAGPEGASAEPGPDFAGISRDGARLYLARRSDVAAQTVYIGVIVQYPIDPVFDAYVAAGATVVQPPQNEPWAVREFVLGDPDGHQLRFGIAADHPVNHGGPVPRLWGITPELPVPDVAAAQAWYQRVLGFATGFIAGDGFGSVTRDGLPIFLIKAATPPGHPRITIDLAHAAEVDRLRDAVRASGGTIVEDVVDKPWGVRQFVAEDASGQRFRIGAGVDD